MRNNDQSTRYLEEEVFHDEWAKSTEAEKIDVLKMNESVTAPEMRYITRVLGDLEGKTLLDIGCGLGEASVYFALKGALVTSTDISGGMLEFTEELARKNNTCLTIHKSTAEDLAFAPGTKFDIIYVGNLFHHVDIEDTLGKIEQLMDRNSVLVSWDPVKYNPLIEVYRRMATDVRTVDEHPFRTSDLKIFKRRFGDVKTKFFWLSTLSIFIMMYLVQFRNPNKERYWKVVVEEGHKWRFVYQPLAILDRFLLKIVPPLGWLCWNIVIISKHKNY